MKNPALRACRLTVAMRELARDTGCTVKGGFDFDLERSDVLFKFVFSNGMEIKGSLTPPTE